jgi:hypothetical protein
MESITTVDVSTVILEILDELRITEEDDNGGATLSEDFAMVEEDEGESFDDSSLMQRTE